MKASNLIVLLVFFLSSCSTNEPETALVDYINPLIGTAPASTVSALKHGHGTENNAQVVPYVTVPFGMTNWTPQTKTKETKCIAPYYYTDSIINGFRGSHWLSGSCVQDYGSMTVMPVSGELICLPEKRGSHFSHDSEIATPYRYKVHLTDYGIQTEMTASKRCGVFRFTYEKGGAAHIVLDPNSDEGQGFAMVNKDQNEIAGYNPVHRIYQEWGEPAGFSGYFVARFSRDFDSFGVYHDDNILEGDTVIQDMANLGAYASFKVEAGESIEVMIGTSFTSMEEARKNLEAEVAKRSFEQVETDLKATWEKVLNKIKVEGGNDSDKVKFYTALYHSFLAPRTFNDADGSYPSFAGGEKVLHSGNRDYYVDFSMWDTYRASHPLFNLIMPDENANMMMSLLDKAKNGGWLPIFPCWNSYTSAMIGDHVIATLADAYLKNTIDLTDDEYAYLLQNAFETPENYEDYKNGKGRRALSSYLKYGYVPLEDEVKESFHKKEQVSRTLEYAFDDFALSQVALKRKDTVNAQQLLQRALNYQNVFSKDDACVRGRFADGSFTSDFDKEQRMSYITEGTPWQYSWYVPHDFNGLMNLMGGHQNFSENLDQFHASGQYWHGNEPGHQIPFIYNYCGQPWKTQQLVSQIMKDEYDAGVGGLSGNDDAGQMSAWYVFAAMGFYPVCPSVPEYVISGPHFDQITIDLGNNELVIKAPGATEGNIYIQDVKFNGETYSKNYLNHFDLLKGGTLEFEMGSSPNKEWGANEDCRPFSLSR
ncbi:GH92 family glycosyl hydrolase [Maribellus sp. YY47]|uniref:GH92 family glycosyl hydrolase n=1 Tax=Maribellus sp. YY47 TaxID=2929486 RepID=UPI0020010A84|nr:GH92 family glycosyl hydrolase [Maribellus sp. YY47]MCK3684722.1 GH92 family glycosyl hydrolase [Maribellus sp. YY47]